MNTAKTVPHAQPYYDRLTPGRALAASLGIWLVVFLISPISPRWSDVALGYILLLLGILGLAIGCALPDAMGMNPKQVYITERVCRNAIIVCTILGMIGLVFKLYDIFVLRGVSLEQDVIQAREISGRTAANPISTLAAIFSPFANGSLLMAWYAKKRGIIKRIGFLPMVSALAPIALPFLFGSRSGLLVVVALMAAAHLNLTKRIAVKDIALVVVGLGFLLTIFALVFVNRVERSGVSLLYAARLSAYTQVVPLQQWVLNYMDTSGEFGPILAGYTSLMQYLVSGIFEFLYLVELKDDNFGYGDNIFFFIPKFFAIITNSFQAGGSVENYILNPRGGVFQTFFGDFYLDFGIFSPIFVLVYGLFAGLLRLMVKSGNMFAFPLYALFLAHLLLGASVNTLSGALVLTDVMLFVLLLVGSYFTVGNRHKQF